MQLTRVNFECSDCGFIWRAPIWEPLWASKLAMKEMHSEQHTIGDGRTHPVVALWLEWEQNRIIDIIDSIAEYDDWIEMPKDKLIARIKEGTE